MTFPATCPTHGTRRWRQRSTMIGFDPDTYETILARAQAAGHSFNEEVRCLVEWGLESVDDRDRRNGIG